MSAAIHIFLFGSLIFNSPKEFPDLALKCGHPAGAKSEPVEMPRATAFLVSGAEGRRLEDRFDAFDLWRSESIRARWCDSDGNRFSLCRLSKKLPNEAAGDVCTRLDWQRRSVASPLKVKDLAALDEAVYMLSPVDVEERVKPRRSQRQNLSELWRYSSSNENAFVYAFCPRAEKEDRPEWYLAALLSSDPDADEKMDRWLDEVERMKPSDRTEAKDLTCETDLLVRDYRRSVVNHSDWQFTSATNLVVVDNLSDVPRDQFISALTNGLPVMQMEFRKALPSPLSGDSHIAAVRIFASREEYLAYVGPEMKWSAALWSPQHRELVLYYPEQGSDALLRTVWHEALHQHLDYACSMIQSPVWFNEGHAVLFEHAHFDLDGNIAFDVVPDAVAAIKSNPSEIADWLPAFLEMDYPEFYSGSNEERVLKYHVAWSVAYFLQVGAPQVRFQPFKNLRSDMMKALVRTRRRDEAVKAVFTGEVQQKLVDCWLSFWKEF